MQQQNILNNRADNGQFTLKRNDLSRVIETGMDANVFRAPWQDQETKDRSSYYSVEQEFREQVTGVKKSHTNQWEGQLPYQTTPKSNVHTAIQMIPEYRNPVNRVCFREAVDNSGPFYLRHWQIWDNAPFLPSNGDVTLDPKYMSEQTKGFTTEYHKLPK